MIGYPKSEQLKSVKTKKDKKPIKQVSTKNSNTPAKFTKKVKKEILDRDKVCCLCWDKWVDIHHIYFSNQAERWKDRNNIDKGLLLCRKCHDNVHWCKVWQWIRQESILYVKEIYKWVKE